MSLILLDGAMGTQLINRGLKPGEQSFLMNMRNPQIVAEIHKAYEDAGSGIVYTNTFGVNTLSVRKSGYGVRDIVKSGVEIAKNAVSLAKAALDIGPLGFDIEFSPEDEEQDEEDECDDDNFNPSAPKITEESACGMYAEIIKAGADAGADIIIFETMFDLRELRLAVKTAHGICSLPIFATMTFEPDAHTFYGCSVSDLAGFAEEMKLEAVGLNCSYGPEEMFPVFSEFTELTNTPLIAKPNAGMPDEIGEYKLTPEEFANSMLKFAEAGAAYAGGCCGTSPAYISALRKVLH